ncbi:MAG: alpha/beta hydrolase [Bacilli bacterium]|nr:alpha/beta hydrolase [Bacilli bacterium]
MIIKIIVDNNEISYLKKGTDKTKILFLHGWGCSKEIFQKQIDSLSKKATVYSLDFPGFGQSSEPTKIFNVDDYVNIVIKFIEKEKIKKISIVGHSFGGRVIIKLANVKQKNFKIDKLVLIDAAGIKKQRKQTLKQKLHKIIFSIIKKISPAILNKIKTKVGSSDYRDATPMMRDILVKTINEDLKELIPKIKEETLIIWGEKDDSVPFSDALYMKEVIKGSGIVSLPNSGHFPFLDNPELINKVLESFLINERK